MEKVGQEIAALRFGPSHAIAGPLSPMQTRIIDDHIEDYRQGRRKPTQEDYSAIRGIKPNPADKVVREEADFHLVHPDTGAHSIVQLKFGGNLDTGKAPAEKRKAMRALAVVSNQVKRNVPVSIFFATGYNMFGEGRPWEHPQVLRYFAPEELLIGRDFWNCICRSKRGYAVVTKAYAESTEVFRQCLQDLRQAYLG